MQTLRPDSPDQLAEALRDSSAAHHSIQLGGNFSKDRLGGPIHPADVKISTCALRRLLCYDPHDLTISVEAGMPWRDLECTLAEHRQMLPLDPPWRNSTVGGVVAANLSGPRRRHYGTARDLIIGMTFATVAGKQIQAGGMVVKNVAGLDMAKLMVGSFGTLAAMAVINFKVVPAPVESRTFEMRFETAAEAFAERDRILRGLLQPSAIDILNWPSGFRLLIEAAGSPAVLDRFSREFPTAQIVDPSVWDEIRDFTPNFLATNPNGGMVPIASSLTEMPAIMETLPLPAIARAGSGVIYAHYPQNPPPIRWSGDFAMMEKVKNMFDPEHLLNRGRLYGRL